MDKHEMKARMDAQLDEWKNNLETMKAKAAASQGQTHVEYTQTVADLQKQYDDLKIKAAAAWDAADDKLDSAQTDLELGWEEWVVRAKRSWSDLTK